MAAAATVGAVAASAASSQQASAASGGPLVLGQPNTADASTGLTVTSGTAPTLSLTNGTGPTLFLSSVSESTTLATGQIANTDAGPLIGLKNDQDQSFTSTLVTGADLAALPVPTAIAPARLLDTRYPSLRTGILRSSANAFDSSGSLLSGKWLDLAIADAGTDSTVQGAFLNLTVTGALGTGFLVAYPTPNSGDARPNSSTLNYVKNQTIANGTFVAVGVFGSAFAVRIYAAVTTQVIVDLNGAVVSQVAGPSASPAAKARATRSARTRPSARFSRSIGLARRR